MNTGRFAARNFGQMAFGRWHRFGYACVNFGVAPLHAGGHAAARRGLPRRLPKEERAELVADLGRRLMEAVGEVVPVLPVSLVATVLLADPGKALGEFDLKGEAHALVEKLEARGHHVYIPRQDREYAIAVGLRMLTLRNLVVEKEGLFTPVPEEVPLLRYYANAIAHLVKREA